MKKAIREWFEDETGENAFLTFAIPWCLFVIAGFIIHFARGGGF